MHIILLILKYSQFHSDNCENKQPFLWHRKQDRRGNQRPHFITKARTTEIKIDYLLLHVDFYVVDILETCWKDINEWDNVMWGRKLHKNNRIFHRNITPLKIFSKLFLYSLKEFLSHAEKFDCPVENWSTTKKTMTALSLSTTMFTEYL